MNAWFKNLLLVFVTILIIGANQVQAQIFDKMFSDAINGAECAAAALGNPTANCDQARLEQKEAEKQQTSRIKRHNSTVQMQCYQACKQYRNVGACMNACQAQNQW